MFVWDIMEQGLQRMFISIFLKKYMTVSKGEWQFYNRYLPQTDFVFDIQISEKDLLELLLQKVYNMVG